jgi:SAM-dependent methyltransferase
MRQEVQKNIWDREQISRMKSGDGNNRRRLGRIFDKIKQLSASQDISVLNIGIGNGLLESRLMAAGVKTYSLDPSENAVQAISAKLHAPAGHFQVGSCAAMPFPDRSFDFIVMSEVIEHLDDPTLAATVSELRRTLKPGGYFIGTCPDNEDVVAKTNTCPHCGERFHRVGHVRSFTKQTLHKRLSADFDVKECYSFRGMHLNWKGIAMYWYNSLPYRIAGLFKPSVTIPQSLGQHLFFVAQKP